MYYNKLKLFFIVKVFLIHSIGYVYCQQYSISILGIPIAEVSIDMPIENSIVFKAKTIGLFGAIWHVDNTYTTIYDSSSFGIREYNKNILQGNYKGVLNCKYDADQSLLYYNGIAVSAVDTVQNIFMLLNRLSMQSKKELDAIWFPLNHEGSPYRARFLFAGNDSLILDTYKIDIRSRS